MIQSVSINFFRINFFRNIYCLLPGQPYSLRISINIWSYMNSFSKQTKKIDQEELVKYLQLDLLKKMSYQYHISHACFLLSASKAFEM